MGQPENDLKIVWKGTNGINFWTGREGESVAAIVDHCMSIGADGTPVTLESCAAWFANPKSEVSTHFGVGKDGRVWQFVDLQNTAWGNGILEDSDLTLPWVAECVAKKINPNRRTISIEHEGNGIEGMPEAQYQATLALHRYLLDLTGLPADRQHIIGHYQITAKQRAHCPGQSFPWSRLLKDLAASSTGFKDPVTGFLVNEPFASYWKNNGGLAVFGRPIGEAVPGGKAFPDCQLVQWFERARFELHPGGKIMLGLVGSEARNSVGDAG